MERHEFIEWGRYFGYPECCIQWFVENRVDKFPDLPPLTPQQDAIHGNNGFIPCPTCAEKVTAKTIGILITNRVCPIPYSNISIQEAAMLKLIMEL
jgi:hypothetical protein